jgi:medium-chain acyl-[acyl-carrier-protein] hydrolase
MLVFTYIGIPPPLTYNLQTVYPSNSKRRVYPLKQARLIPERTMMNDSSSQVDFTIRPDEADRNGLCTIRTLCNLFQHSAFLNAQALDFGVDTLGRDNKTWMLTRLLITVDKPARYGDTITVSTWPTGLDKLFALRDFKATAKDGATVALGTSSWCVVDLSARRIVRPEGRLSVYSSNPRALERTLGKIEPIRRATPYIKNLDVRFRDIDVNRHVNNVSFIEWMCEAVPYDILSESFCSELEINFLKEAFYGDTILSFAAPLKDNDRAFHHALRRKEEEEDAARAMTIWTKIF